MNSTIGEIAADSVIGRTLQRLRRTATTAWNGSGTARLVRRGDTEWRVSSAALRIQIVALLIVCASVTQIVMARVLPPYTLSGLPSFWFIAVAAVAGFAAVFAQPLATAWPRSRVAKITGAAIAERYN